MRESINSFSGFVDEAFETLLDSYQMKDWGISWENFVSLACQEFLQASEGWKAEEI